MSTTASDEGTEVAGRRRIAPILAAGVLLVLAAFVFVLATSDDGGSTSSSALIGRPAPPIEGETIDGAPYVLTTEPGEWVLVNFFATWCVPCIREHPDLVNFHDRHTAAGDARVVSVLYDDRLDEARDFFAENGGDWPVVEDPDGRIALQFGVAGVPESYLVGPDGTVLAKVTGGVTASGLDQLLARAQGAGS